MNARAIFSLIILFFLLHTHTQASEYVEYEVSGVLLPSFNGIYTEAGTHQDRPYYIKITDTEDSYYVRYLFYGRLGWSMSYNLNTPVEEAFNPSNAQTPPETGWVYVDDWYSDEDEHDIRVVPAGPRVSFSTKDFLESFENAGSFEQSARITIVNQDIQFFAGNVGDDFIDFGYAIIDNLPDGLTAKLIKQGDVELELFFVGQANAAKRGDNVEVSLSFQDAAFENGSAEDMRNALSNDLSLRFRDELWVGSGHDYSTITAAIAAANSDDIIRVEAGTYTEKDIVIDKNLSIIGAGVGLTIVQAAAEPNVANGRVFNIPAMLTDVLLSDMTIRHGSLSGDMSYGGAVRAESPITMRNCEVHNNQVDGLSPGTASGGGIYARSGLVLDSCTIWNNRVVTGPNWRFIGGGGIHSWAGATIVNSTFYNNRVDLVDAVGWSNPHVAGGGILIDSVHNPSDFGIFNSTFVGNTLHGEGTQGAGIALYAVFERDMPVELVNNVVDGNFTQGARDEFFLHESVQAQLNVRHSIIRDLPEDNRINPINVMDVSPGTFDFYNDYGGNVWVVAWSQGSPTNGAGLIMDGVPDLDQRGYSRSGSPDIGSFQHDGTPPVYVTYYANGASGIVPELGHSLSTNKSFVVGNANELALANHNFTSWNTSQDGTGLDYEPGEAVTTGTEDIHLYAQWLAEYTLTYTAGPGGRIVGNQTQIINEGASGTEVAAIADTGYSFVDWSDGLTSPARLDTNVSADLSVTANFAINEYTVTFFVNGEEFDQQQVEHGSAALDPGTPSVTGYSFVDWDTDFSAITSDLTINAILVINTYTVRFLDWNGGVLLTQTVRWNSPAKPPESPTREGYTFSGWDVDFATVTSDLDVTAQYDINTFTVRFLDWDDSVIATETVNWNEGATAPADPEREGYTFTGWSVAFDVITANLDVTAQYDINTFTVR
ncbi:MAG: InlB B-repeat-containing protein, partial [Aliidiomarina sp.]|uniref:InlB B-repeat-containing protein n=1 Tax=Aliidiomarina sp. TaxID=1872439 RepID=UPI0025BBDEFB